MMFSRKIKFVSSFWMDVTTMRVAIQQVQSGSPTYPFPSHFNIEILAYQYSI